MTPAEFRAWLDRRGLSQRKAAPLFGVTQQAVNYWCRADDGVELPGYVARIIELLDRIEHLEAAPAAGKEE